MQTNSDTPILISRIGSSIADAEQVPCITFRFQVDSRSYDLYVKSHSLVEQPGLDAAIPLAILPAMRLRKAIHVNGAVSRTFIDGVKRAMRFYATSFEGFSEVPITADSCYEARPGPSQRRASFFSGGVDSFFTLLKGRNELTDIITIRGFDMSLGDADRWEKTRASAHAVAAELGIRFHELESNFGSMIKEFGLWIEHGHGLALACAARSLAGLFAEIRIPGTFSSDGQIPWGSSAFSDPEFSDERLAIIHDTCAATRTDKIEFLAQQPLALQYLRVCPGVKNDANYNCCRCEKCLRTMVSLYACGALERAAAFPLPLTPELVSRTLVLTDAVKAFTDENIRLLQRYRPENDEMLKALRIQRDRPLWLARLLAKTSRKRRHLRSNLRRILDRAVGLRRRDGPAG